MRVCTMAYIAQPRARSYTHAHAHTAHTYTQAEAEVKRLEGEINKPKKLDKGQTLFGL